MACDRRVALSAAAFVVASVCQEERTACDQHVAAARLTRGCTAVVVAVGILHRIGLMAGHGSWCDTRDGRWRKGTRCRAEQVFSAMLRFWKVNL